MPAKSFRRTSVACRPGRAHCSRSIFNNACRSETCVAQSTRHLTREPLVPREVQTASFGRDLQVAPRDPFRSAGVRVVEGGEPLTGGGRQRRRATAPQGALFRLWRKARVRKIVGKELDVPERETRPHGLGCRFQRRVREQVSRFMQRGEMNIAIDPSSPSAPARCVLTPVNIGAGSVQLCGITMTYGTPTVRMSS